MDLTALDIKQQTFAKTLRGYDTAEVNAYLQVVSTKWEHMVARSKDLEREVSELRDKLKHYERVEEALHETLQTAKESAEQRMTVAKKDAQSKIEKAELEAEAMVRAARQERQNIKQSTLRLLERREEIVRGIKSFLELTQESLESFKRDDSNVYNIPVDEIELREQQARAKASSAEPLPRKSKLGNIGPEKILSAGAPDLDSIVDQID